jgi:large subunit ribosomal protein L24
MKVRFKRGDRVRVMAGSHKGEEGRIIAVLHDKNRVVIENVNVIQVAQRPTQENPRGGYAEREAPIHASNVQLLDPQNGEPTRIGATWTEGGRKVRIATRSGTQLDD